MLLFQSAQHAVSPGHSYTSRGTQRCTQPEKTRSPSLDLHHAFLGQELDPIIVREQ